MLRKAENVPFQFNFFFFTVGLSSVAHLSLNKLKILNSFLSIGKHFENASSVMMFV